MKYPIRPVILLLPVLLHAGSAPASAGGLNGGPGWGAVVGAGILGGVLGSITAPPAQPQQIIIVPQPTPSPPTVAAWCSYYRQWFPAVQYCPGGFVLVRQ